MIRIKRRFTKTKRLRKIQARKHTKKLMITINNMVTRMCKR